MNYSWRRYEFWLGLPMFHDFITRWRWFTHFLNLHIFVIHTYLWFFLWIHILSWFAYICWFLCEFTLTKVMWYYISISRSCTEKSCFPLFLGFVGDSVPTWNLWLRGIQGWTWRCSHVDFQSQGLPWRRRYLEQSNHRSQWRGRRRGRRGCQNWPQRKTVWEVE